MPGVREGGLLSFGWVSMRPLAYTAPERLEQPHQRRLARLGKLPLEPVTPDSLPLDLNPLAIDVSS
jgi:hypothetical protein